VSLNGATGEATVAVDAMGGDFAPIEVVKGAVEARDRGVPVVLVGRKDAIRAALDELRADLPIVAAAHSIAMDEPVSQALRRDDSSLRVAANLVSSGDADAVVSCGNSAAIMGIALHVWGRLPGIDRPAFGGYMPSPEGGVFVLDIGANPDAKTENLVQFAIMGEVYAHLSKGLDAPRIALLSNGSEDSKGTKEVKEANQALRKLDLNFIGNVEGNHVFEGGVDVVVCDGFAGNVLLKGAEGVVSAIFDLLKAELSKDLMARLAAAAMMPAFTRIKRRVDYEEYGGAPVLGVNELMINCHGRSKAKAVSNAISLAHRLAKERLIDQTRDALQHDNIELGRRRRLARAFHLRSTV
jgi:glycerol-3-phosphate acyltransferase PlsX